MSEAEVDAPFTYYPIRAGRVLKLAPTHTARLAQLRFPHYNFVVTAMAPINRRSLLASTAALGGSLALGFAIPFGSPPARASGAGTEITAWIVIGADDSVVIRVARSEMGQ